MTRPGRARDYAPVSPREIRLLGVRVHLMTIRDMQDLIEFAIEEGERLVMVSQNLHSVYLAHREPGLQEMQSRATYVRVDGLPLIWFARMLGYPARVQHRNGWLDWFDTFVLEAMENSWKVFYLGSTPEVVAVGTEELARRYPRLSIKIHHGHFDMSPGSEGNEEVLGSIAAYAPDILIVGMGMPRQERWILANEHRVNAAVILTAGACLDQVVGAIPSTPRWLGRIGLEWLYRLIGEPRRLWRRYLLEPWFGLGLFILDLWGKISGSRHRIVE